MDTECLSVIRTLWEARRASLVRVTFGASCEAFVRVFVEIERRFPHVWRGQSLRLVHVEKTLGGSSGRCSVGRRTMVERQRHCNTGRS